MIKKILALVCAAFVLVSAALGETDMIIGESAEAYGVDVTLYFPGEDGASLVPDNRTIMVSAGEEIARKLVEALLTEYDRTPVVHGNAEIIRIERCGALVTVNLAVDASAMSGDEDVARICSAICLTLTGADGIECVNVLFNSLQEEICDVPVGVMRNADASIAVNMARYEAEGKNGEPVVRSGALYFPAASGIWMLSEEREMTFEDGDYAGVLIDELEKGPADGNLCVSIAPGAAGDGFTAGDVYVSPQGLRLMDVSMSGAYRDEMALRGIADWQLAASAVMTLCSFVPSLDGVRILVDDELMTGISIKGTEIIFEDGVMVRSMFDVHAGNTQTLYFPVDSGLLRRTERAVSPRMANSPRSAILQLISGPSVRDEGAAACMPEGVTADDVLGVAVRDKVCIVNMSANFYRLCQTLDSAQERALVYSVVNTLCEMDGIDAVSILIEGEKIGTLSNDIYPGAQLMPNYGIIEE